jgi:hypothetical protein
MWRLILEQLGIKTAEATVAATTTVTMTKMEVAMMTMIILDQQIKRYMPFRYDGRLNKNNVSVKSNHDSQRQRLLGQDRLRNDENIVVVKVITLIVMVLMMQHHPCQ